MGRDQPRCALRCPASDTACLCAVRLPPRRRCHAPLGGWFVRNGGGGPPFARSSHVVGLLVADRGRVNGWQPRRGCPLLPRDGRQEALVSGTDFEDLRTPATAR